jgi:hypothetical protein
MQPSSVYNVLKEKVIFLLTKLNLFKHSINTKGRKLALPFTPSPVKTAFYVGRAARSFSLEDVRVFLALDGLLFPSMIDINQC